MPNRSDTIYSAHNVKYFTNLDLIKGYYQVLIDPDSREFRSFSTHQQQYQFKRLSFGLRNSALQFQKIIQEILSEFKNKRIIIYVDDILILSESFEEFVSFGREGTENFNGQRHQNQNRQMRIFQTRSNVFMIYY